MRRHRSPGHAGIGLWGRFSGPVFKESTNHANGGLTRDLQGRLVAC
jgi:hypothetical protein